MSGKLISWLTGLCECRHPNPCRGAIRLPDRTSCNAHVRTLKTQERAIYSAREPASGPPQPHQSFMRSYAHRENRSILTPVPSCNHALATTSPQCGCTLTRRLRVLLGWSTQRPIPSEPTWYLTTTVSIS